MKPGSVVVIKDKSIFYTLDNCDVIMETCNLVQPIAISTETVHYDYIMSTVPTSMFSTASESDQQMFSNLTSIVLKLRLLTLRL